jgi:hypothetical protein
MVDMIARLRYHRRPGAHAERLETCQHAKIIEIPETLLIPLGGAAGGA